MTRVGAHARYRVAMAAMVLVVLVAGVESGRVAPRGTNGSEAVLPKAAAPGPSVVVDARPVDREDEIEVEIRHWPVGAVTLTVCGRAVRHGSADCDLRGSQGAAVGPDGSATATLALTPPEPCPCVVMVWSPTHALVQTAEITPTRASGSRPLKLAPS